MKARVKAKKTRNLPEGTPHERLELLIACGHPIFIMGNRVCWPAEADFFFTEAEMDELESYILAGR